MQSHRGLGVLLTATCAALVVAVGCGGQERVKAVLAEDSIVRPTSMVGDVVMTAIVRLEEASIECHDGEPRLLLRFAKPMPAGTSIRVQQVGPFRGNGYGAVGEPVLGVIQEKARRVQFDLPDRIVAGDYYALSVAAWGYTEDGMRLVPNSMLLEAATRC